MKTITTRAISTLGLSSLNAQQISVLKADGLVTLGHLIDVTNKRQSYLRKQHIDPKAVKSECQQYIASHGLGNYQFSCSAHVVPPCGWVLDPKKNPQLMQYRADTQAERNKLSELACSLAPQLPEEYLLTDLMHPVRNQGQLGSCTGFGSTNSREFLVKLALSCGYSYRGAKYLDGYPELEGSWQEFAFEFMYRHGSVLEDEYTYDQCLNNDCVEPYFDKAAAFKIESYIDLLVSDSSQIPLVLKAALSGFLVPELGPQPVAISAMLYESICDGSVYSTGLLPVPDDFEECVGGHAMCVAGYVKLYDLSYFIVINSWGEEFARDSPLGLPGYALIPEAYIAKPGLIGELIMPVG